MNRDEAVLNEDPLDALVVACDEALAAGLPLPPPDPTLPDDLRRRLDRVLPCLQRLHRAHSRQEATRSPSTPSRPYRFEILRELGRGGFGIVYLARDNKLGREVALKLPHLRVLLAPDLRRRFLEGARLAANLNHPHILSVLDCGLEGPFCYLVSEFCAGGSLADWLAWQTEPVPEKEAAELLEKLAEAVHYLHSQGLLHRDLKPANILLAQSPGVPVGGDKPQPGRLGYEPKIIDFGLARFPGEPGDEAVVLGTPPYLAPEQADSQRGPAGPTADLYSLGAILYECLTGRPPHSGPTAEDIRHAVLHTEPIPPRRLRPPLPRDLETITLTCLCKEPSGRYASAAELADDLHRWANGEPIRARRPCIARQLWNWLRPTALHGGVLAKLASRFGLDSFPRFSQNEGAPDHQDGQGLNRPNQPQASDAHRHPQGSQDR